MKIAVVTDDRRTLSAHFGRAGFYVIFTIEEDRITEKRTVNKTNHRHASPDDPHQAGHSHNHDHSSMLEPILGCDALITGGMGMGAYNALKARGIQPVITDIREIDRAVDLYLAGVLVNHLESLH